MGTKWKNIKNNVRAFWLAHRTQILTGFLALLALALFLLLAFDYRRMNTRIVWSFGLAMNLIRGRRRFPGGLLAIRKSAMRHGKRLTKTFMRYGPRAVRSRGKVLLYITGAALAGVAVFLIIKKVTDGIWYLPNYAYFYLLLFTVLLQYLALSMTLKRFIAKAKLDAFVAGLKELNRTRVARGAAGRKKAWKRRLKVSSSRLILISNVSRMTSRRR